MSALWQILRGKIGKYFTISCCRLVRELPRVDAVKKCPRNPTGNSWKSLVWKVGPSSPISNWELHAGNVGANIFYINIFYFIFQEESPEGGRFKKEVVVDGQSFLLLIRDEGGPPELQVTHHHSGLKSKK